MPALRRQGNFSDLATLSALEGLSTAEPTASLPAPPTSAVLQRVPSDISSASTIVASEAPLLEIRLPSSMEGVVRAGWYARAARGIGPFPCDEDEVVLPVPVRAPVGIWGRFVGLLFRGKK
jgi:hypothetical protein